MSTRIPAPQGGAQRTPFVPWRELWPCWRDAIEQGQHTLLTGPTGSGKSTLLLEVARALPVAIYVATKRSDPIYSQLLRAGWPRARTVDELRELMVYAEDGKGRRILVPSRRRILYWPAAGQTLAATRRSQRVQIGRLLDFVDQRGYVAVCFDEVFYAVRTLGLGGELEQLSHSGRSHGVSMVSASQRPAWLPRSLLSSCSYFVSFATADPRDLERIGDLGAGVDTRALQHDLRLLREHEFVLCLPRRPGAPRVRSIVELPGRQARPG